MKKKLIISHTFVALVCILLTWFFIPKIHYLEVNQANTTGQGVYNAEIWCIVDGVLYYEQKHNIYTSIGKTFERDLKFWANVTQNATYGKICWVSLSNDASPSASWTELTNEAVGSGADRKAWDSKSNVNDTTINGTVTFTFTGTITLQCAGIQWSQTASSNNNLYAVFAFTQTTFNNNDQLIIKYYNRESGT